MSNIGKRFFHLIDGTIIFGECETVVNENNPEIIEILIKQPYTVKVGKMIPYMGDIIGESPAAVQIHPMNILWTVPLDEFNEIYNAYIEITSGITLDTKIVL